MAAAPLLLGRPGLLAAAVDPWAQVQVIVGRIRVPRFPARDFRITAYGAVAGGRTDCTKAINAAIKACNAAGGGRVVVPAGRFLTGALRLLSNVNLYLAAGATLAFSTDPAKYLPVVLTRFEGNDCYNYSPLIYAYRQTNIAITGPGTLDGQASVANWWPWRGNPDYGWSKGEPKSLYDTIALRAQGEAGTPVAERVYGPGHYLRPPFIQPYGCTNVLIEGVTLRRSPFWMIHPLLCTSVTVRGVTCDSIGPNSDGCDIECCNDVLIERCTFNTLDDCVVIKSGRGRDGIDRGIPSKDIVIRDCRMHRGGGGIAIGSEASGGARNIYAERLVMDDTRLLLGILIKSNSYRGGTTENVWIRDIDMAGCEGTAIRLTYYYTNQDVGGPYRPVFRNINISDLTCRESRNALDVLGYPDNPIRDVSLTDCTFTNSRSSNLNVRNASNLKLTRFKINSRTF